MTITARMRIDQIAIWVYNLEKMKDFHSNYFDVCITKKYQYHQGFFFVFPKVRDRNG